MGSLFGMKFIQLNSVKKKINGGTFTQLSLRCAWGSYWAVRYTVLAFRQLTALSRIGCESVRCKPFSDKVWEVLGRTSKRTARPARGDEGASLNGRSGFLEEGALKDWEPTEQVGWTEVKTAWEEGQGACAPGARGVVGRTCAVAVARRMSVVCKERKF